MLLTRPFLGNNSKRELTRMLITDLTMDDFTAGLKKTRTVLIPFGSTEEHGPHLPLDTDTMQAVAVARRLAERRTIFVAPPVHYGVCRSTGGSFGRPARGAAR